jgi:HD-like signal output (HDOD) protein
VDSSEVIALLRQDPSLVAQIIRMANSVAYAPTEPVGSIERALASVGFVEAHRMAGVVAARQLAGWNFALYPFNGNKLQQNALYVAVIMEELARETGEKTRSCYTVGLLRTIGMMMLERLAGPDSAIPPFATSGETVLDVWERKHWGTTNVEVAEQVLLRWRLPHETVSAIRHHYRPANRHNPVLHLLTLAATSAADRFFGIPGEESYWTLKSENFIKAGLTELKYLRACERAQRTFDRLTRASA